MEKKKLPDHLRKLRPGAVHRPPNNVWIKWQEEISRFLERPICGAKTAHGHPCPRPRMKQRNRCPKHGGKAPRGAASHAYIHGRHDFIRKALPQRLRESFLTSLQDENLLELRAEIALVDQQLLTLLRKGRMGSTESAWEEIDWIRVEMHRVMVEEDDPVKVMDLMVQWGNIMNNNGDDPNLRAEIRKTMDLRRKLVRGEQLRLEALQGYITNERMLAFIAHVVDTLVKYVPREYLKKPMEEIGQYIPTPQLVSTANANTD